jgi:uncharacterized protein YqjF (DUF2071 family)
MNAASCRYRPRYRILRHLCSSPALQLLEQRGISARGAIRKEGLDEQKSWTRGCWKNSRHSGVQKGAARRNIMIDASLSGNAEPLLPTAPIRLEHPVMHQRWEDLTFLHWRYPVAALRPMVPATLALDVYDGMAWVGVSPFKVTALRLPHMASLPWLSTFPETNVRTYVVDAHGYRGVWFFSLDAARLAAVVGARLAYALPYFWANMRVDVDGLFASYTSTRLHGNNARNESRVHVGPPIAQPSDLDLFLTARFRLYAQRNGTLLRADIEHPPWPLQRATVLRVEQTLIQAAGLPPTEGVPLAHFSRGVDVRIGPPRAVKDD